MKYLAENKSLQYVSVILQLKLDMSVEYLQPPLYKCRLNILQPNRQTDRQTDTNRPISHHIKLRNYLYFQTCLAFGNSFQTCFNFSRLVYSIIDLSIQFYTGLFNSRLVYSILDLSIQFQTCLFNSRLVYSIHDLSYLFQTCLFNSRIVYSILDLSILFQTCLFYYRLVYSILDLSTQF